MRAASETLRELASEYALAWPEPYLRLADDGTLDRTGPGADGYAPQAPSVRERVPLLFFDWDFEPLAAGEVREALAELHDPADYRDIDPAEGFLPFGRTPGGDLYCFHTRARHGDRIPVVLIARDYGMGQRLAGELQAFIASEMVTSVAGFGADQSLGIGDPRENMLAWLRTHRTYLSEGQAGALENLYRRPLVLDDKGGMRVIDSAEAEALVQRIAPYPERGQEFAVWGEMG